MNKLTKIFLILAALLIGLGTILGFAAHAMEGPADGDDPFPIALDSTAITTETYTFSDEIRRVTITDISCDVRVFPSPDGSCSVVCSDNDIYKHEVTLRDGTLSVTAEETGSWTNRIFNFTTRPMTVTVFLPHNEIESLSVQTTSGGIELGGGLELVSAELSSVSGDISCVSGVSNGLDVETTSGEITLEGVNAQRLSAQTISGSIDLEDCAASGELLLSTTSGEIELERCDGGDAELCSISGDIEGTILSPKEFLVETLSGKTSLPPSHSGSPQWRISTTSGDIELSIKP